jgi:subtilisin family serine protease
MNKKLIAALIAITLALPTAAQAAGLKNRTDSTPTIAILDTGIDTSLPAFQGKIVQEVCILEWTTCPNGKSFMEGTGAASMPSNLISQNGFDHGTLMTSVFLQTNPNANIVFIKIIGNTATGLRQNAGEASVYNALNWVKSNALKYNIQAVSMSQGHHTLGAAGTDYCPKTPITEQAIKDLMSMQIPVFFPSGNGRDYTRIDWPACLDVSVSVGYVDQQNEISASSNNDSSKLDFFAPGFFSVAGPGNILKNISGSSAAIQVAAGQWLKLKTAKPTYTYDQIFTAIKSTASSTVGRQGTFNKLININAALSYAPQQAGPSQQELAAQAKAKIKAEVDAAIAAAEAQYQIELKAAQDKLAATKAQWLAKLNG